jgi:hypothetical protein
MDQEDKTATAIGYIRRHHRQRRFAMKMQQKIDRALESWVRINFTDWSPNMGEADREKRNALVQAIIKKARQGITASTSEKELDLIHMVAKVDISRAPWDEVVSTCEMAMREGANDLPVYPWIDNVHGVGALGLATIVAEADGPLTKYGTVSRLWKRLGYNVYDGYAGSTWRREKWRPRTLEKEEWTDVCFSPVRYAMMKQLSIWLRNAQWIGAKKTGTGTGKPDGHYGTVYAMRRAHTAITHPDWTPGHAQSDALRVMFKEFLKDLWKEWRKAAGQEGDETQSRDAGSAAGQLVRDAQEITARRTDSVGQDSSATQTTGADGAAAGQSNGEPQAGPARRRKNASGQRISDAQSDRAGSGATAKRGRRAISKADTLS